MLIAKMYGSAPSSGAAPQFVQQVPQRQNTIPEENDSQQTPSPQHSIQQASMNNLSSGPGLRLPPLDFMDQSQERSGSGRPQQQSPTQVDTRSPTGQSPQYQPSSQLQQSHLQSSAYNEMVQPSRVPQEEYIQNSPTPANVQSKIVTGNLILAPKLPSPSRSMSAGQFSNTDIGVSVYGNPVGNSRAGSHQEPAQFKSNPYPSPSSNSPIVQSPIGRQIIPSPTHVHTPPLNSSRSSNDHPPEPVKTSSPTSYSRTVSPGQQQGRLASSPGPLPVTVSSVSSVSFSEESASVLPAGSFPTRVVSNQTTASSTMPTSMAVSSQRLTTSDSADLAAEAGVLYLLQDSTQMPSVQETKDRQETWSTDEEDSDFTSSERKLPNTFISATSSKLPPSSYRPDIQSDQGGVLHSTARQGVGRRPSGARAKPGPHTHRQTDTTSSSGDNLSASVQSVQTPGPTAIFSMEEKSELPYDDTAAALAALSFLEQQEATSVSEAPFEKKPLNSPAPPPSPPSQKTDSLNVASDGHQYRSSFVPSRQAAERKAKALAQQEATYAATHKPGKPKSNGGTKNIGKDRGAWDESSDEEEEEEEDEEEDEDEDEQDGVRHGQPPVKQPQPIHAIDLRTSVYPSAQPGLLSSGGLGTDAYGPRGSRILPQPPTTRADSHDSNFRVPHDEKHRIQSDEPKSQTLNPHVAARQSVWSTVLDQRAESVPRNAQGKDTFVQVEESETMTKAFQPQGLLSAGLQDKEDRSAKRQEELARESGASLINVPNKPPPPQTGLLGAITAHERERKREGGVGAALTERERERRLAEERQRKLDDLQRQQLDQMSQGGVPGAYDNFGQQGFMPGFDPRMSMNPMMLNPYMTGGFQMMPFNPQQLMAAQMAAQQAYQQAMVSFSQAGGSQMGDNSPQSGALQAPGISPQSTGSPSPMPPGGMMGMDPRISMNMNPWMGMGGMGMGMTPMGMNPMNPMGMNPMAMMDPRMSMAQSYPQRPDSTTPAQPQARMPSLQAPSPRNGSPAPQRSTNNSPRPPA